MSSSELLTAFGIFLAGLAAGTMNTVVGAGTLITFPALLAAGLAPVTANVTNTVGLVSGSFSGAWGYRRELAGQRARLVPLSLVAVAGGLAGGILLLTLPSRAFDAIVPVLIGLGCALVVLQPWISRALDRSRPRSRAASVGPLLAGGMFVTSAYGGYFGAAQGVLHVALLTLLTGETVQRSNAAKNWLAALVNLTAAVLFAIVADVAWGYAGVIAVGSTVGGQLGAAVGRRLPDSLLRGVIVTVGVIAIAQFLRK
ncbi:MAG: sulfite exporter TauE/SafE family protein [Actinomycetota bacterium]|nr:sulfite exporter TauE/SafE family protein [Actinomycetota bacterium]